jgi:hypothetical protein
MSLRTKIRKAAAKLTPEEITSQNNSPKHQNGLSNVVNDKGRYRQYPEAFND